MDRFSWCEGKTDLNERTIGVQANVRLYDGEDKVNDLISKILSEIIL